MEDLDIGKLEEYFFDRFPVRFDTHSQLSLLFLLIGEKPGANVMFVDESKEELLEDFCEDFDLEYQSFESEIHMTYYITLDEQYFDLLEKVDEESKYYTQESSGKFLGYPENAIKFFTQETGERNLSQRFEEKVDEMIEKDELSEENSYLLDLALFTPELTSDGVLQAVEVGERRRELLRQLDRRHDTDFGEKILDKVFSRSKPYFRSP